MVMMVVGIGFVALLTGAVAERFLAGAIGLRAPNCCPLKDGGVTGHEVMERRKVGEILLAPGGPVCARC